MRTYYRCTIYCKYTKKNRKKPALNIHYDVLTYIIDLPSCHDLTVICTGYHLVLTIIFTLSEGR